MDRGIPKQSTLPEDALCAEVRLPVICCVCHNIRPATLRSLERLRLISATPALFASVKERCRVPATVPTVFDAPSTLALKPSAPFSTNRTVHATAAGTIIAAPTMPSPIPAAIRPEPAIAIFCLDSIFSLPLIPLNHCHPLSDPLIIGMHFGSCLFKNDHSYNFVPSGRPPAPAKCGKIVRATSSHGPAANQSDEDAVAHALYSCVRHERLQPATWNR